MNGLHWGRRGDRTGTALFRVDAVLPNDNKELDSVRLQH